MKLFETKNKQVWEGARRHQNKKDHFDPNLGHKFFFFFWSLRLSQMLDIVPSCNLVQYQGKRSKLENIAKNLILGLILPFLAQIWPHKFFCGFLPLLDVIHCYKLSLYATSKKTKEPNLPNFAQLAQFQVPIFSSWILPLLDVRQFNFTSYHCMQFQGKRMSQS